ncbi:CpsD/CapB family tyrosine-protein kinase [Peribacillus glennii]|uniref:non-specific protein-tyrosine kinase n=1 Tax=Peribacillus glennii TaxID=2303991 RepID=A0A372LEL5_9BACI|nr:polysaccharide biosynthesis tyrosine autokinase [Peribacillus glennii]
MSRKLKGKNTKAVNLIAYNQPKLHITEQYRLVRTNILFSSVDRNLKTIIVTSPEPSEGKTTTAANLAIVLAQQGKHVLLVDADLRKPSVHHSFKVSNIQGLTSVLTKKTDLEEAIYKTHVPFLNILTSGPIPPNPAEILDSKAMEMIIEKLKGMFEFVIFDTPPVLAVTDSQIIANKCDGIVMVVASGKTNKEHAVKTKELLEKTKSKIIGVVVNGVDSKRDGYYYEYGKN